MLCSLVAGVIVLEEAAMSVFRVEETSHTYDTEDRGGIFHQNVCTYPWDCMLSYLEV
jgi:hypothetical protein